MDARKVLYLPVVHWLKPTEEVEWVHYTKAGGPQPLTELFIVDVLSKREVRLEVGDPTDHYFYILGWRPDGSELLFLRMNREFKQLDLMAGDPSTGATRNILTETSKTFIGGLIFQLTWPDVFTLLEDGRRFIWMSERDGWNHLYLYDLEGKLIRRLTGGDFPVVKVIAVDEKAGWVYFAAHAEKRLYDTHLYRVNLDGQGFTRLTEASGQREMASYNYFLFHPVEGIRFSPSKEFFLDTHSDLGRPPAVELRRADGKLLQVLSQANVDALRELKWKPPEEFTVKVADKKTDVYGILYRPFDFDPGKKYPVVNYIYNGPWTTWVPRTFTDHSDLLPTGELAQALAQVGFVVLMVDGRGTPERSKAFLDVVYRNFGRNETPDHVATLHQLAEKRPYLDLSRVGIFGHSWGGYMTLRAMLLAPDVYHVGIASSPVVDVYDHSAGSIEGFMGLPASNPEGYEYAASPRMAGNTRRNCPSSMGPATSTLRSRPP